MEPRLKPGLIALCERRMSSVCVSRPVSFPTAPQSSCTEYCIVKAKFHYAIQLANQLVSWFASWIA